MYSGGVLTEIKGIQVTNYAVQVKHGAQIASNMFISSWEQLIEQG